MVERDQYFQVTYTLAEGNSMQHSSLFHTGWLVGWKLGTTL
jgi:hypothetical protein